MSDRLPLREVDLLDVSSTSDDIFKSMVFIKDNKIKMLEEQLAAKGEEIKRLQEENESQKTDYIIMNKRYEAYIGGPGDDVKLLKEQLAKWKQVAIEERADHIAAMHVLTGMVPIRSIPATVATVEDHVAGFRERAAKELGLQIEQEASYVKRLEEKISDFYECDATRRGCCRQVAQDQAMAALAKIREGKE